VAWRSSGYTFTADTDNLDVHKSGHLLPYQALVSVHVVSVRNMAQKIIANCNHRLRHDDKEELDLASSRPPVATAPPNAPPVGKLDHDHHPPGSGMDVSLAATCQKGCIFTLSRNAELSSRKPKAGRSAQKLIPRYSPMTDVYRSARHWQDSCLVHYVLRHVCPRHSRPAIWV